MHQPDVRPVLLCTLDVGDGSDDLVALTREAHDLAVGSAADMLAWSVRVGAEVALPAGGATVRRWELLASVGAQDLSAARVLEPHLDAFAILAEDGQRPPAGSSWGVWAAEGPGARLEARGDDTTGWTLEGRKPWCSLAGSLTHALVTAWVDDSRRRLFAVDLADPGLTVEHGTWVPAGLARVLTTPVAMTGVGARPVGATGWYLERDGFWWGGIGVAACWYGGAVGLGRRLARQLRSREPDQLALMHLGEVDASLAAARACLVGAAGEIDGGRVSGPAAVLLGARVRHVVATTAETVARHVAHALGPAPLSQEPEHVARVADLALYVRQHHAERDAAGLGRMVLDNEADPPW